MLVGLCFCPPVALVQLFWFLFDGRCSLSMGPPLSGTASSDNPELFWHCRMLSCLQLGGVIKAFLLLQFHQNDKEGSLASDTSLHFISLSLESVRRGCIIRSLSRSSYTAYTRPHLVRCLSTVHLQVPQKKLEKLSRSSARRNGIDSKSADTALVSTFKILPITPWIIHLKPHPLV
jgi:hypothetical protein